jgi:hypothetical protein
MPQLCLVDARGEEHAYPIMDDVVPVGRHMSNRIVRTDRSVGRFHLTIVRWSGIKACPARPLKRHALAASGENRGWL